MPVLEQISPPAKRGSWTTVPNLSFQEMKNIGVDNLFSIFFAHRDMEQRFTMEEKILLGLMVGQAWQERKVGSGEAFTVGGILFKEGAEIDVLGNRMGEVHVGDIKRMGRYKNNEFYSLVDPETALVDKPFYFWANIFREAGKDAMRARFDMLRQNPNTPCTLLATAMDMQRGDRPAIRENGLMEIPFLKYFINDLSRAHDGPRESFNQEGGVDFLLVDTHGPATAFYILQNRKRVLDLTAMPILLEAGYKLGLLDGEKIVFSGDQGAAEMAAMLADALPEGTEFVTGIKEKKDGSTRVRFLESDLKKVKDKTVIIGEDIIDSGGTIISMIVDNVLKHGAKRVVVLATNGVFSEGAERLCDYPEVDVIVSDSMRPVLPERIREKFKDGRRKNIHMVDIMEPMIEVMEMDIRGELRDVYQNPKTREKLLKQTGLDIAPWLISQYVVQANKLIQKTSAILG